jgi:uncharacterized protein YdeI (YjbR/CyaY-like superfamily)
MTGSRDRRIDDLIDQAAEFARPVMIHLRELVHQACPEVTETIKWGMPCFDYKGPYCNMAAFKKHCAFVFWKAKLMNDPKNYLGERAVDGGASMGQLGRITSLDDLPPDVVMLEFLTQGKLLNESGIKLPSSAKKKNEISVMPEEFEKGLNAHPAALAYFQDFSPSQKKEYIDWLQDAKTDSTRKKRIDTALEWISEGKIRNWKYLKK